jgi:hypothetical protein
MLVYLPRNLAALTTLACRHEHPRFAATQGIRVLDQRNGLYRAEVTDGRRAAIIQGPIPDGGAAVLDDPVDGVGEVLVPAADWKEAFRLKGDHRRIGLATNDAGGLTFATDTQTLHAIPLAGRFPDINAVLPKAGPLVAVRVDPVLLAGLLQVAGAVTGEEGGGVTLLFFGKDKPLGLSTRNGDGQAFDALLVPLVMNQ